MITIAHPELFSGDQKKHKLKFKKDWLARILGSFAQLLFSCQVLFTKILICSSRRNQPMIKGLLNKI